MPARDRTGATAPVSDPVGYANPPVEHRFREGSVANPWGRKGKPKPRVDFLEETLSVQIAGRRRRITRDEALDHALYKEAMAGNVSAVKLLEDRRTRRISKTADERTDNLKAEDQAALHRYLNRFIAQGSKAEVPNLGTQVLSDGEESPSR